VYHSALGSKVVKKKRKSIPKIPLESVVWRGGLAPRESYLTEVFIKSFDKSQCPHKFFNVSSIVIIEDKSTDFGGN